MKQLLVIGSVLVFGMMAQAKGAIGYELLNETQDGPSKTYTMTFEVWSADVDATSITVIPKKEGEGLEVTTKAQTFTGAKRNKRFRTSFSARNATKETKNLNLEIRRKSAGRTDTKTISVLVAPQ